MLSKLVSTVEKLEGGLKEADKRTETMQAELSKAGKRTEEMQAELSKADRRANQLEIDLQEAKKRVLESEKRAAAAQGDAVRRVAQMEATLMNHKVTGTSSQATAEKDRPQPVGQAVPLLGSLPQEENSDVGSPAPGEAVDGEMTGSGSDVAMEELPASKKKAKKSSRREWHAKNQRSGSSSRRTNVSDESDDETPGPRFRARKGGGGPRLQLNQINTTDEQGHQVEAGQDKVMTEEGGGEIESDHGILTAAARKEDTHAVSAFEDDQSESALEPTLQPLRPSWSNLHGAWNRALAYKFTVYMLHQVGQPAYLTAEIKDAFLDRLKRLRRLIRQHCPQEDESPEAMKQRIDRTQADVAKRARVTTRRSTLNNSRLLIAEEERDDEGEREAWRKIGDCVQKLTAAGMSSDDSDEDGTRTVRKMPWRSPEVARLLITVDGDANRKGLFGASRPGNPGKPRKRRHNAGNSRRNAVPGLPINFYNEAWLETLRDSNRAELGPQDEFEIPDLSLSHNA
ncbi:hypothetical protein EST38_g13901 [Candolleomyces aberdarensis]|uniref:Uncharacterized protein n=1 Tax=Candolleomyces aberdarensis TaxID=2316362 RepID=A0A4Q2D1F7_9AGAR|nr:hypothetical protein EST38_g13901 [Candolleomyces aberdarensis]